MILQIQQFLQGHIIFPLLESPLRARAFSLLRPHDHTQRHHARQDSSRRVTGPSQRLLPYNTQHSQQTDFHDPNGIRIHNISRREAADDADSRLRPGGHRDRPHHTSMNKSTFHVNQQQHTAKYQYMDTFPFPCRYTQHYL